MNWNNGSSPRERGTPYARRAHQFRERFIPARAGNTCPAARLARLGTVHPRASGEHFAFGGEADYSGGSSPRERGTLLLILVDRRNQRFIPARAGNTEAARRNRGLTKVHPRASGEHRMVMPRVLASVGSSPRERGTRSAALRQQVEPRFIPARAGNTSPHARNSRSKRVHPRASGEHAQRAWRHRRAPGSSPRERGTQAEQVQQCRYRRFIPARAGNT